MAFFHLMLTREQSIDSVELYGTSDCGGSHWDQTNTAGCHSSGAGIGSFKIIAGPHQMRDSFDGLLMNESDPFSTSAYPPQGNKASVTPADDCFDKDTGAYVMGCNVERFVNNNGKGLPRCPALVGTYKNCTLEPEDTVDTPSNHTTVERCWLPEGEDDGQRSTMVLKCPLVS